MIEAVSAILVHDDEVFVVKRQPYLRAFPGYLAFPGGKIDAEDAQTRVDHPLAREFPDTHLTALNRELSEELDFDMEGCLEAGMVREISLFGTAVTPDFEPVRFSAYYYKIALGKKPEFTLDHNEIAEGYWENATRLSEQYRHGEALMVVPMRNTLFALSENISATGSRLFNVEIPRGHLAVLELLDGLKTIPVPSHTLPPAVTTNALYLGDSGSRRILVDPSPRSDEVYTQLVNTLDGRTLDAILITHHHPDHHERAMQLAREKGIPVLLSARTQNNLELTYGKDYTSGIDLELISEGQAITFWKNSTVRVYELPGHDDGMVGLAPDNMRWFFVSDLAQSDGSILIPEKGGDLTLYLHSLRRVIGMQPEVILPSHGIPSGGTRLLERTLQHREFRETQIRPLFQAGADRTEILKQVYPDLDAHLHTFALQTIDQHIHKLELEQNA